ncbi:metallophosphoesterase family protein [Flavobacterium ardleyense]|uniref:Metallophosphoesterase family protein n=1 Tax=Flavobacterium ardleyense TaxID=2038737 RepID=A0ABW5Z739_9FLAO
MKKFVIGDIHGGLKALVQVLNKIKFTSDDTLIFLGDYVDGWSESPAVLDYLIELQKRQKCIFIRGNHDELVLDWLTENNQNIDKSLWYQHGGEATVLSYQYIDNETKAKHIVFLKSLQNYHLDENNRLYLHAGFSNLKGVAHEHFKPLFYWDRTLWEMAMALDRNLSSESIYYPKRLKIYHEIFIGHTPVTYINEEVPVNFANVWNVDTGAAFKGKLTIMDVVSKEFEQSDPLPDLYPNEKGRN